YTYSAGTGATDIPGNIGIAYWVCHSASTGSGSISHQSTTTVTTYFVDAEQPAARIGRFWSAPAFNGVKISGATSVPRAINIGGFMDTSLGVGPNPLL